MAGQDPSPQTTLLILLGASSWPRSDLESSLAFEHAKNALQAYFLSDPLGFHLPESNVLDLFNSNDPGSDILDRISDFLQTSIALKKVSNTALRDILVYFVGHGGITKDSSIFYLAIRRTRKDYEKATSIAIDDLAERLKKGARFQRRILILDCCFAASAVKFLGPATTILLREKTIAAFEEKDQGIGFPGRGTSFLGSSGKDVASIILPDESSTMFTSALLSVLHTGDPFQQKERLTLHTIHRLTRDFLSKTYGDDVPQPELHSPDQTEGKVEDVPFFPNPAARGAIASADIVTLSVAENQPQLFIQAQPSQERSDLPSVQTPLPVGLASPTSINQPHSSSPGALISVSKPGGNAVGVLFRRRRAILLLVLAFILLIGTGSVLLYRMATITNSNICATPTATITNSDIHVTATATAAGSALAAAVSTNGIMYGFDAAHSHFNPYERILSPATVSRLNQAWTAQTAGAIPSSPAVANGIIYVGSQDGKLYAFKAAGFGKLSCMPLWTAQTAGAINSSPAVANGVVYIGSNDNQLYAFKTAGCKQSPCMPLWRATTGNIINSSPTVANSIVYIGSHDDYLYAFKAAGCGQLSCRPLWRAQTGNAISSSSPAVANGIIYVGSTDDYLYAFKASSCGQSPCMPMWTATTGAPINSSPAVANGIVYVGSTNGKLYAFKAAGCGQPSCVPLWTAQAGADINYSSPAVANGIVYVGSTNGKLYAFKAVGCGQPSCMPMWTAYTSQSIDASSPTIANGVVYVGSQDDYLYAFNASNGNYLWSLSTGKPIYSSPAVANGVVYVGSNDDRLYAFSLPD